MEARRCFIASVCCLIVLALASPALARENDGDQGGFEIGITTPGSPGSVGSPIGGGSGSGGAPSGGDEASEGGAYEEPRWICPPLYPDPIACYPPPAAPAAPSAPSVPTPVTRPPPTPGEVAQSAYVRIPLPAPVLSVRPATLGMINTTTTLTIPAADQIYKDTPFAGGALRLRATPVQTWVSFGNHATTLTSTATATNRYTRTGCYHHRVQVTWYGEWSLDGTTWTAIGWRTTRTSDTYPVARLVAVLIDENNPPPPDDPVLIARQICDSRNELHEQPWPG